MCKYICTCTYIHANIHVHVLTYMYTCANIHVHALTYMYTCANRHVHVLTYMYTYCILHCRVVVEESEFEDIISNIVYLSEKESLPKYVYDILIHLIHNNIYIMYVHPFIHSTIH